MSAKMSAKLNGKTNGSAQPQPGQKHIADNLNDQLGVIMVQMGRIMKAQALNDDHADVITMHARKRMAEATDSFHNTLDEMEIEIMRAKAVFLRDLEQLRAKKQAAAPIQAQPPAPMVIDLDGLKSAGPAVPVAPMMAGGGSPFVANRGIPKAEGKPVAPFPDMGMGMGAPTPKPAAQVPFSRAKPPVEQKRPSPKQPTPKQTPKPAPKANPPSGRMGNKPNPSVNAQKPAPKPPATAPPPSAPAVTPAPVPVAAPPAPMSAPPAGPVVPAAAARPPPAAIPNVSAPQNPFTNATFTVDPTNNDPLMQHGGGDINMDMPVFDMDSFGAGGPEDPANMGTSQNDGNDTTMSDLDHFFDLSGDANADLDDSNFNNMEDYMNTDFANFDNFD